MSSLHSFPLITPFYVMALCLESNMPSLNINSNMPSLFFLR
nr:MAG TPA: hypothetical protein [Ackermannviridae sp.]